MQQQPQTPSGEGIPFTATISGKAATRAITENTTDKVLATSWAVYLIITRNVASKYSPVTQMKYVFLISAIVTVPIAIPELPLNALYTAAWGWDGVLEMAFIVVCATALGFFLIPFAMKYLQATTVSIYTNLQPVVASFVAILLGQDILTWDKPVAGILVLLSAYIVTVVSQRK